MNNSNETNNVDLNNINTKQVIKSIFLIVLVVVGFYFVNFHNGLSEKNEVWGTFGDYLGGILNPIIAAFAFYLIAKTYELQKRELEATRSLLEVSTNAQKEQLKLAALTAIINSNLTRIGFLKSEKISLEQGTLKDSNDSIVKPYSTEYFSQADKIENEIRRLINNNYSLVEEIRKFL